MEDRGSDVSVWMDGAHLSEEDLLSALNSTYEGDENGALDLVLGCRGALRYGASEVSIAISDEDGVGYRWVLGPESEESCSETVSGDGGIQVVISFDESVTERFGRFVKKLSGYVGQRPEFKMVERLADRCPIPVLLNGESIVRPFYLPEGPLELKVGQVSSVRFSSSPMHFELDHDWSAGLVYHPGKVSIVVRGVVCGSVDSADFSGVVYHDSLGLDLTRENVRVGEESEEFLDQLEDLRFRALARLSETLKEHQQLPWFFSDLFHLALETHVEDRVRSNILDFLRCRFEVDMVGSGPDALLWAGVELVRKLGVEQFSIEESFLLRRCSLEFKRVERQLLWVPMTLNYYQTVWPERTLVRGYLLLGWGALYEVHGVSQAAQECWLESLDTVRAGTDNRAEELIHAHMDFEPEHILVETGKALALHAARGGR